MYNLLAGVNMFGFAALDQILLPFAMLPLVAVIICVRCGLFSLHALVYGLFVSFLG